MKEEALFTVRPVEESDADGLLSLLEEIPDSITSLQPDRAYLEARIHASLRSFYPVVDEPGLENYLFVLEDLHEKRLAGTCSIYARTGGFEPFYTYEIVQTVRKHDPLDIEVRMSELQLRKEHEGPSELGGLFLHPDYRSRGLGGLLSRSRLLFASAFPDRFTEDILAEFRGVVQPDGEVPFWEAIGRHFFVKDFPTIDQYSALARKDFIEDLMPKHPIYIPLLPESSQDVIGQPHPAAVPAVAMLEKEGFHYIDQVDIFDAGPVYQAKLSETTTVAERKRTTVKSIDQALVDPFTTLIAKPDLAFRCVKASAHVNEDHSLSFSKSTAEALQVQPGDDVFYLPKQS